MRSNVVKSLDNQAKHEIIRANIEERKKMQIAQKKKQEVKVVPKEVQKMRNLSKEALRLLYDSLKAAEQLDYISRRCRTIKMNSSLPS